jgi:hypothetical protein
MTKVLRAFREKPMSARQKQRVDDLISRYHGHLQTLFGALMAPGFSQCEDGSETEIEIVVAEDESAAVAASEFRACGFVVTAEQIEVEGS